MGTQNGPKIKKVTPVHQKRFSPNGSWINWPLWNHPETLWPHLWPPWNCSSHLAWLPLETPETARASSHPNHSSIGQGSDNVRWPRKKTNKLPAWPTPLKICKTLNSIRNGTRASRILGQVIYYKQTGIIVGAFLCIVYKIVYQSPLWLLVYYT
jgi:hypothetical protein